MRDEQFTTSLRKLARLHSIQLAFRDTLKRRQIASERTLLALLAARGVSVGDESDCRELITRWLDELAARTVPPSIVLWTDEGSEELVISAPAGSRARLSYENGETIEGRPGGDGSDDLNGLRIDQLSPTRGRPGRPRYTKIALGQLPIGYYALVLEIEGAVERSWVAVAPRRAFEREGKRFGAFAPGYAIRSA